MYTHTHTHTHTHNVLFLDVDVKLLVAEKQQWLLHQRMSRAKDMQISKLQHSYQMQGKCI